MQNVSSKRTDIRFITVENELMLHDQKARKVYVLNPTAAFVWSLCDGVHTIEQIVAAVKTQFSDTIAMDIPLDVRNTIAWFTEYGLLKN